MAIQNVVSAKMRSLTFREWVGAVQFTRKTTANQRGCMQ